LEIQAKKESLGHGLLSLAFLLLTRIMFYDNACCIGRCRDMLGRLLYLICCHLAYEKLAKKVGG